MVYVLAVAAALSNALCSVFQRMGVEDAPEESTMRLSLLAHAIRRGVWLLGFVFIVTTLFFKRVPNWRDGDKTCGRWSALRCSISRNTRASEPSLASIPS